MENETNKDIDRKNSEFVAVIEKKKKKLEETKKKIKQEEEEYKEEYKEVKKLMDEELKKSTHKKPGIFKKFYVLPIVIVAIFIILFVVMYFTNVHKIYIIVLAVFTLPVAILLFIYGSIRLYIDRKVIKNKVIPILPDRNFIVANFFMPQKRIRKEIFLINKDGKSFNAGKEKQYILDFNKIWYDTDNYPNSFYLPNLPNPMSFNFSKQLNMYAQELRDNKGKELKNINIRDWENEYVDVSYSSSNLAELKKDKFVQELHRDPEKDKEYKKIIGYLIGVIVLLIAMFMIYIIVGK